MERMKDAPNPPSPRELRGLLFDALEARLPRGWRLAWKKPAAKPVPRADAILMIRATDGRSGTLIVEVKKKLEARDVPLLAEQVRQRQDSDDALLVAARYLSPRAREALVDKGVSYFDATGNIRVVVDNPGLFVSERGLDSDPWRPSDRPTSSLRGTPASRVVRALVDFPPPRKVREVSELSGASLGSTSRTIDFLDREALIERDENASIIAVDWSALLERWAVDYDIERRRRVTRLFAPRGAGSVADGLRGWAGSYAISGSLAGARWQPFAAAKLAIVYATDTEELQSLLKLVSPPTNPNVLVIEPDDDLPFDRRIEQDGLFYAAPSQVVVDLLGGPGRNPEEGRALIDWMKAHEAEWRAA